MSMFGERLRQLRSERGITLGRFATLVHYNKGYLSRIENGQKDPTEALARACDEALERARRTHRRRTPRHRSRAGHEALADR